MSTQTEDISLAGLGENAADLLFEAVASIVIGIDDHGVVMFWNKVAEQTFGITTKEVLGLPLAGLELGMEGTALADAVAEHTWAASPLRIDEIAFERGDGTPGFLGLTFYPIPTVDGTCGGAFILGKDITELKLAEERRIHARKLQSVGQLAAGMAHELNTPVQYLSSNLHFLEEARSDIGRVIELLTRLLEHAEQGECAPEVLEEARRLVDETEPMDLLGEIDHALQQSREGAERMGTIIRAMVDFSGLRREVLADVPARSLLEAVLEVTRHEWESIAEMDLRVDDDLPAIRCYAAELNQAILQVLANAFDAIRARESARLGRVLLEARRNEGSITLAVEDDGVGITEENQSRVFEPFFTTKGVGEGTGQGLTLARSIVHDMHGGEIEITSRPGYGTRVSIDLPLDGPGEK
jgi:PAS domain S-box-containing protein